MSVISFVVKTIPPIEAVAGLRLDTDSSPLADALGSAPALINKNLTTPVASTWATEDSYGIDMGSEVEIDGVDVWSYIDDAGTYLTWGTSNSTEAYESNDNSTWTLIRSTLSPPIFSADSNSFCFRFMFDAPVTARYFKVRNKSDFPLEVDGDAAELEITEMAHRIEDTPDVTWSATEQSAVYGGALTNPVVAIKQTGTTSAGIIGTIGYLSGKYYFEIEISTTTYSMSLANTSIGIRKTDEDDGNYDGYIGSSGRGAGYFSGGRFYRDGSLRANDAANLSYGSGHNYTIGVYADLSNNTIWFSRDGSIVNKSGDNGNPETGVDPAMENIAAGTYYPAVSLFYSLASAPPNFVAARLNAMSSNILYLPSGSSYTPWDND